MTVSDADTAKMEGPQATDKILTKEGGRQCTDYCKYRLKNRAHI